MKPTGFLVYVIHPQVQFDTDTFLRSFTFKGKMTILCFNMVTFHFSLQLHKSIGIASKDQVVVCDVYVVICRGQCDQVAVLHTTQHRYLAVMLTCSGISLKLLNLLPGFALLLNQVEILRLSWNMPHTSTKKVRDTSFIKSGNF